MLDRNSSTPALEAAVEEFYKNFPYPDAPTFAFEFCNEFDEHCIKTFRKVVCDELGEQIAACVAVMYLYEAPKLTFERETHTEIVAHARYRDKLLALLKFKDRYHLLRLADFKRLLTEILEPLVTALPPSICITANGSPPKTPLVSLLSVLDNPKTTVDAMLAPLTAALEKDRYWNDGVMGAITAMHIERNVKERKPPIENSPFTYIFEAQIPSPPEEADQEPGEPQIDERSWYSHALLLAQPGAGKTNAIRWRIMQLIPQIRDGRTSLIVLDPKGVLTHEMLTLARAQGLGERVVFIDPEHAPVSVNLFSRDGTVNETIARISRVLGTITSELTAMQRDNLTFALRALFSLPDDPTLATLRKILRQGKSVLDMERLPEVVAEYFEYDFKEADGRFILSRLNSLLSNTIFENLFSVDRPSFDIGKAMQAGRLIVINAGLSETLYGRFWIEEIARTIQPRIALQGRQLPTTFIIDEAQEFIAEDLHFARILDTAREARIGMFIAAHHMGQIDSDHVKNSLYNCQLKFVAKTNADIHNLCRSMGRTEPDFLGTTPQYQFAFFGPNMDEAVRAKLPLVEFARARQEDVDFFTRQANRDKPTSVDVEKIALHSPSAAILEMRRIFEDTVRAAVTALSLPDFTPNIAIFEMIGLLEEHQVIDGRTRDLLHHLRLFGNKVAHNTIDVASLTTDAAMEFREAVERAAVSLQSQTPPPRDSQPRDQEENGFDTNWKER
jgi:hypothetical protein